MTVVPEYPKPLQTNLSFKIRCEVNHLSLHKPNLNKACQLGSTNLDLS